MNEKLLNQQENQMLNLTLELLEKERERQALMFKLMENMLKKIIVKQ